MSDVTVAPPSATPADISPQEVPINPSPTTTPVPATNTPPPESPAEARKAAIQRAFDRANDPQAKPKTTPKAAPKPVEAKAGHNQPPEETPPEKRPAGDLPRGERGQFAPRVKENLSEVDATSQRSAPASSPGTSQPLPETAPYREPHPRMTEKAKQEWAAAPESVRGEFHRLAKEAEGAYQAYRSSHEAFQPIAHFHQMAQQHGTTLDKALTNYVGMEQKLRQDVVGGLDLIVNNLNLQTPDGQKLGLRDVAYHILNQSPEQHRLVQQGNAQGAQNQQIGQLYQTFNTLAQSVQQLQTRIQFSDTRSAVDQFADAHPRFDELGDLIENELRLGFDLDTAYARAELLRPGTAAQTRGSTTSAQTRTPDRSISGAPDAGPSNGTSRRADKAPVGRRDAIQNAIRRVNGAI
jgi:hypothetical protein